MPDVANEAITILVAEDDSEDRLLIERAMRKSRLANELRFVGDGEQLMDFLRQRGDYTDAPEPGLILLDLNMPRKDGREALEEIKHDDYLKHIPVVVLTTSKADEDIARTYAVGANSFIAKPVSLDGLVNVMQTLGEYWFHIVRLPVGHTD